MRSIRLLAGATAALILSTACGDGGGTRPPDNEQPEANFVTPACVINVPCTFTSTSSDDKAVTGVTWDFNTDGTVDANTPTATYTYTAAAQYVVSLTARDAEGLTHTKTAPLTIAPATPVNQPPTANFTAQPCVINVACTFTDASTDDVGVTTWSWDFNGDGTVDASTATANYTYTVAGTYPARLIVTDAQNATDDVIQDIIIAPGQPSETQCTPSSPTTVDCVLSIATRSTLNFTVTSVACQLNSRVTLPPPVSKTVFFNVCARQPGEQYNVPDATGAPTVFEAGTQLVVRFTRGEPDPEDPAAGQPQARYTGTSPNWNISIDDGGNVGGPGEPDFTDVVLTVQATAAP